MGEQVDVPGRTAEPSLAGRGRRGLRTIIVVAEVAATLGLLAWWLSSASLRSSRSLWVLFLYCFPAEFLISTVPHEPVILYFGELYAPLTVALITAAGTVLTEAMNYTVIGRVADMKAPRKIIESGFVRKLVVLFRKAPFAALLVAGFTPIPFYPFRILVVLARYPLAKYLLAVALSRTPRFFLLALAGRLIRFRPYQLIIVMAVLILAANIPLLRRLVRKKSKSRPGPRGGP
jgi:membrane protein YqaA with SNARE-associated domain